MMNQNLLLAIMVLLLSSCSELLMEDQALSTLPTLSPTPAYIMRVNPIKISKKNYNESIASNIPMARGVIVTLNNDEVDLSVENTNIETVSQRSALYINDLRISQELLLVADGMVGYGGPYYLSWAPELKPGVYEARFEFTADSGEVLKYTWYFCIY